MKTNSFTSGADLILHEFYFDEVSKISVLYILL